MHLINKYRYPILFVLSWILWIFAYRGFFLGDLTLMDDARSYYEHFRFYIDQLRNGQYPMWDPTRQTGVPMEFFLRRIGSYNPFFILMYIMDSIGIPHLYTYFCFLGFYYILGMLGYYMVAKTVLQNKMAAFAAYLLFFFSSIAGLLFNSFIFLVVTPGIWFFYFLIHFVKKPAKIDVVGLTFCLMLLLTTYIPFYFITILISFLVLYIFLFCTDLKRIAIQTHQFFNKHPILIISCFLIVCVSILPGYNLYKESKAANFVMPERQQGSDDQSSFAVQEQTTAKGGIISMNFSKDLFSEIEAMELGKFYYSPFIHLLLLLGIMIVINRRLVLLVLWGFGIYIMSVYGATPVYQFLYKHVFYFKYFRNFQFFLWMLIMPVFALGAGEHLRQFLDKGHESLKDKWFSTVLIFIGHFIFVIFLAEKPKVPITTYFIIGFSFIFFISYIWMSVQSRQKYQTGLLFLLFILIVWQPVQAYNYLNDNARKYTIPYRYDDPSYFKFFFPDKEFVDSIVEYTPKVISRPLVFPRPPLNSRIHFGTKWHVQFKVYMKPEIYRYYHRVKFYAYDHILEVTDDSFDMERFGESIVKNENLAYVVNPDKFILKKSSVENTNPSPKLLAVAKDMGLINLLHFDVNHVRIETNFKTDKFLVFNDSYYPGWIAFIDGRRTPLFRTNLAYKGLWVPSGKHIIEFRFGLTRTYVFNYFLLVLFWGVFIYLILLQAKKVYGQKQKQKERIGTDS